VSHNNVDLIAYDQLVTEAYKLGIGDSTPQDFTNLFHAIFPQMCNSILGYDQLRPAKDIYAATGIDPAFEKGWVEHFSAINPYVPSTLAAPPLEMVRGTDIFTDQELMNTEYYNDFLRPAGELTQGFGISIFKEADRFLVWSAIHSLRHAEQGARAELVMKLLTPHVRRSFELARRLETQGQIVGTLEAALNGFSSPVFICASDMSIRFANLAAEAEMSASTVLSGFNNRLAFTAAPANVTVREKVRGLAFDSFGPASLSTELFTPIGTTAASAQFAFVSPLPQDDRTGNSMFRFTLERPVLVMLVTPDRKSPVNEEIIRAVFGITPAEASLASALALGMSANEYADKKNLSRNTVRVQTQAILSKMGARKQSDISRLMAAAFSGFNSTLLR